MAFKHDGNLRPSEEAYFEKANAEALERINKRSESAATRLSPITGEPMETITLLGIAVDRCPTSGGIWLDRGEIEELVKAYSKGDGNQESDYSLEDFLLRVFRYDKTAED